MPNKQITVPLPLNIANDELHFFKPHVTYERRSQKVKILRNVFVTNSGLCLNNKGLIKECHHDYPSQYSEYLKDAAWYYYDTVDNPENLIQLDSDKTYVVIHHPWFNYYHWVCESIFRLWIVRRKLEQMILILPEYYKSADFIVGSLEPFGIKEVYYIPKGKSLLVQHLCLPQIKPICDSYNQVHLNQVRNFYWDYVLSRKPVSVSQTKKLYISRKLAKRRMVVNEHELVTVLLKFGFEVFYPENFAFLEQVVIFSNVMYVVGMHGSGLTNMLFMRKGVSVLELHKNKTNELDHPSPLFWYMAEALGIFYYHQPCETVGREDYFDGDYFVDIGQLEKNLARMIK